MNQINLREGVVIHPLEDGTTRLIDLDGAVVALDRSATKLLKQLMLGGNESTNSESASAFIQQLKTLRLLSSDRKSLRSQLKSNISRAVLLMNAGIIAAVPSATTRIYLIVTLIRVLLAFAGWKTTADSILKSRLLLSRIPTLQASESGLFALEKDIANAAAVCLIGAACKERALTFMLMTLNLEPNVEIVVGFQWTPPAGHCWCEYKKQVFTDPEPEKITHFHEIVRLP